MEGPPVPEIRSAGGGRTREAILRHLGTGQVSRVIYGAIIGMALIVALQAHPPSATEMTSALLGTAVAVGLAELYSEVVGLETRMRRRVTSVEVREILDDVLAVMFGVVFPDIFFVLAATGAGEGERPSRGSGRVELGPGRIHRGGGPDRDSSVRPTRSSGSRRRRAPAAPSGRWGPKPARERF